MAQSAHWQPGSNGCRACLARGSRSSDSSRSSRSSRWPGAAKGLAGCLEAQKERAGEFQVVSRQDRVADIRHVAGWCGLAPPPVDAPSLALIGQGLLLTGRTAQELVASAQLELPAWRVWGAANVGVVSCQPNMPTEPQPPMEGRKGPA